MEQNVQSTPAPQAPKKSNTPLIIAVIVIVILCICCLAAAGIYYLYQNGDQLFGTGSLLLNSL